MLKWVLAFRTLNGSWRNNPRLALFRSARERIYSLCLAKAAKQVPYFTA